MEGPPAHRRGRPFRRELAVAAAVALVAGLVVAVIELAPSPSPAGGGTTTQAVGLVLGGTVGELGPSFFGLSSQSSSLGSPTTQALVGHAPFTSFRWGPKGEYTDLVHGVVYDDNGSSGPVGPDNLTSFLAFCRALGCHATLAVPGEINDSAFAAATVTYVEQDLGFHPAFWTVGNEPQTWSHFNKPWASWRATDSSRPTPLAYALEVRAYIAAVRAVDPAAQFIGIESAGGDVNEAQQWIAPVAEMNGPNLASVAYHPYPDGELPPGASATDFFGTLASPGSFPGSYAAARAAVDRACGCALPLWAGEYNSALGGNVTGYLSGYPNAVYLAGGLLGAIRAGVPQVNYFTLSTPSPGFGLLVGESPRPTYWMYAYFLENLTQGSVRSANLTGAPALAFALATTNGSRTSLFVVNADPSVNLALNLTASGFPLAGGGTLLSWDPSGPYPLARAVPGPLPATVVVPAEGLLEIVVGGP